MQKVDGIEPSGADWCPARLGHGLLAVGEDERVHFIRERHAAVHHRKCGALRVAGLRDFDDEFRAFDAGGGAARDHADAARLVAMEKREDAANQMQAGVGPRIMRRQDFQFRQRAETHGALVGPQQGDAAVRPGAQTVKRLQRGLVGVRGLDAGDRAPADDFHASLEVDDADFVGRPGPGGRGPVRETARTRDEYQTP